MNPDPEPEEIKVDIGNFLDGSTCATDRERVYLKYTLLENQNFESTTIQYRGSLHGELPINFHNLCDDQKDTTTITLVKVKNGGPCIGGITSAQWTQNRPV